MKNEYAGLDNIDLTSAIQSMVKNNCVIDYGIIRKVVASGVVDVELAVANTEQDIVVVTCVLANIASSNLTLDFKPTEGDRVIVFYPRRYDGQMFDVSKSETVINPKAGGYSLLGGIAFLFNQYRSNEHTNYIQVSDTAFNIKLHDSAVEISTDSDGNISVANGNASVSISKDGDVTINAKGKYKIQNDSTDLKEVLSKLADAVSNLTTEGTQSAQSASVETQKQIIEWKSGTLDALLTSSNVADTPMPQPEA